MPTDPNKVGEKIGMGFLILLLILAAAVVFRLVRWIIGF